MGQSDADRIFSWLQTTRGLAVWAPDIFSQSFATGKCRLRAFRANQFRPVGVPAFRALLAKSSRIESADIDIGKF